MNGKVWKDRFADGFAVGPWSKVVDIAVSLKLVLLGIFGI